MVERLPGRFFRIGNGKGGEFSLNFKLVSTHSFTVPNLTFILSSMTQIFTILTVLSWYVVHVFQDCGQISPFIGAIAHAAFRLLYASSKLPHTAPIHTVRKEKFLTLYRYELAKRALQHPNNQPLFVSKCSRHISAMPPGQNIAAARVLTRRFWAADDKSIKYSELFSIALHLCNTMSLAYTCILLLLASQTDINLAEMSACQLPLNLQYTHKY